MERDKEKFRFESLCLANGQGEKIPIWYLFDQLLLDEYAKVETWSQLQPLMPLLVQTEVPVLHYLKAFIKRFRDEIKAWSSASFVTEVERTSASPWVEAEQLRVLDLAVHAVTYGTLQDEVSRFTSVAYLNHVDSSEIPEFKSNRPTPDEFELPLCVRQLAPFALINRVFQLCTRHASYLNVSTARIVVCPQLAALGHWFGLVMGMHRQTPRELLRHLPWLFLLQRFSDMRQIAVQVGLELTRSALSAMKFLTRDDRVFVDALLDEKVSLKTVSLASYEPITQIRVDDLLAWLNNLVSAPSVRTVRFSDLPSAPSSFAASALKSVSFQPLPLPSALKQTRVTPATIQPPPPPPPQTRVTPATIQPPPPPPQQTRATPATIQPPPPPPPLPSSKPRKPRAKRPQRVRPAGFPSEPVLVLPGVHSPLDEKQLNRVYFLERQDSPGGFSFAASLVNSDATIQVKTGQVLDRFQCLVLTGFIKYLGAKESDRYQIGRISFKIRPESWFVIDKMSSNGLEFTVPLPIANKDPHWLILVEQFAIYRIKEANYKHQLWQMLPFAIMSSSWGDYVLAILYFLDKDRLRRDLDHLGMSSLPLFDLIDQKALYFIDATRHRFYPSNRPYFHRRWIEHESIIPESGFELTIRPRVIREYIEQNSEGEDRLNPGKSAIDTLPLDRLALFGGAGMSDDQFQASREITVDGKLLYRQKFVTSNQNA